MSRNEDIREALLPLGSVVRARGVATPVMIVGRMVVDEDRGLWDYCAVPHPEGFVGARSLVMFSDDMVEEVVFEGMHTEWGALVSEALVSFRDGDEMLADVAQKLSSARERFAPRVAQAAGGGTPGAGGQAMPEEPRALPGEGPGRLAGASPGLRQAGDR